MNNGFKVEWSEEALQNFNYTIQYLQENWSEREIARFVQDVNKGIARIAKFPLANPRTYQNAAVRRYVMTKIHTIYYSIGKDAIYIIAIFDNRQNGIFP